MPNGGMTEASDRDLINAAQKIIRARYRPDWHNVGCALPTQSGQVHLGLHLECYVGRVTVCAEAIAIGRAVTDGDGAEIETIVAVYQASADDPEPKVVAPCGMCREMISDYAPTARVIVPGETGPEVVPVGSLLPGKYVRPAS